MSNSIEQFKNFVAQTSDAPIGLEIEHAEGSFIHTKQGGSYVDFISGIAVSSLGHRHPAVVSAIKKQVDKHLHVMVYGEFVQEVQWNFAKELVELLPEPLEQVYLVNSGTEANEGALKLAKKSTQRTKLVAFHNSYHGDTHGSLSVTGRNVYRDPYLPLLPDVSFIHFNRIEDLSKIDTETAAVIVEPIQGEGGVVVAHLNWLQALRKRCTDVGAVLIFDEIQAKLAYFSDSNLNSVNSFVINERDKLEAEFQIISAVVTELSKQVEQVKLQVSKDTPVFSTIKEAVIPIERTSPKRTQLVIIFGFIGLVISTGFILIKDLLLDVFNKIKESLKKNNVQYLDPPYTRFEGKKEQQETFFIKDPHGNILELKTLKN